MRALAHLGQMLLPPRCLGCGEAGAHGRDLCAACTQALPWNTTACARCALPLGAAAPACGACIAAAPAQAATVAALRYEGVVPPLATRFKFHADLAAGALLAQLMAAHLGMPDADLLVAVPLHRARLGRPCEMPRLPVANSNESTSCGAQREPNSVANQGMTTSSCRRRNCNRAAKSFVGGL